MSIEFFPVRKCLEVCKQWRNFNGEALLYMKLGDGLKAIDVYISYMEKIDKKRMTDQLFALGSQSSNVGKLNHFDFLGKFD